MPSNRTAPIPMACGHKFLFIKSRVPKPGVLVRCGPCRDLTYLPFPECSEWRYACVDGNCRHGVRVCGISRENAVLRGSDHVKAHPEHVVWIISPAGVVVERWNIEGQGEIFLV